LQAAGLGDTLEQCKFRLLRCEILLYERRTEEAAQLLRDQVPPAPPYAALRARKMALQARALYLLSHPDQGAQLLADAHRAAEGAGAEAVLVDIESYQGSRLTQQRRLEEAEPVLRHALARAKGLHANYDEAVIQSNLGMISVLRSRYDEAVPYFESAVRLAGPEAKPLYNAARSNLAMCYSNLGEHERALEIHLRNVAEYAKSGVKLAMYNSLGETGRTYMAMGDLKSASGYLQRALQTAIEAHASADASVWAGNLSECYIDLHDWQQAEARNQEAIRLKDAAGIHTLYHNSLNAARIAHGRGDLAKAEELYQQAMKDGVSQPDVIWNAHAGLGALAIDGHHPAEAIHHFEAAVNALEQTRAGYNGAEMKLAFLTQRIRLYQQYVETLVDQGEIERALAVADSSRAQVLASNSGSAPAGRVRPETFRGIARKSGAVLLSYFMGPTRSHAWVVTAGECHYVALPPAAEIEALVREYKDAIEIRVADPLRTRIPAADSLYRILLQPVRQWIPPGSRVILATDGVLHGLNLEAIPLPGDGSGGSPRYFLESVSMEIAPSLALLADPPRHAGAPQRLLLLGDTAVTDNSFAPLTYAAGEMESVRRSFGGPEQVVLAGTAATPAAYRAAGPERFSAIHFTAHAQANRESPLDSAVLLTGGKLYAREVMDMPLHADLVTVSACRGVGLRTYSGEGLVGFAWAFLHAGARHVIAGLWDVNDQSTAALMDVLYREMAAGKSAAEALRAAKLSLLASSGNLRKPYYWAPFQLYTMTP